MKSLGIKCHHPLTSMLDIQKELIRLRSHLCHQMIYTGCIDNIVKKVLFHCGVMVSVKELEVERGIRMSLPMQNMSMQVVDNVYKDLLEKHSTHASMIHLNYDCGQE